MVKIGSQTIDTNVFLAPLAGCSDLPMRLICREHGARFCFYEMTDSNSLVRQKKNSRGILRSHEKDSPIAGQILGSEPSMVRDAAQKLLSITSVSFMDFNSACPAKKAIKKKAGAYLLKDKALLGKIIKGLSSSLSIPVTVKLRVGFDSVDREDLAAIAKTCEQNGAAALFVHGRTRAQGYMGNIDYAAIKLVKDSVKIPVLGSGNIFSPQLAKKMLEETGCDGVMAARGALGDPWIFEDIENYLKKGLLLAPRKMGCVKEVLKRHLEYVNIYTEVAPSTKVGIMRKVGIWYMKSFSNSTEVRRQMSRVKSYEEMLKLIDGLSSENTRKQDHVYR